MCGFRAGAAGKAAHKRAGWRAEQTVGAACWKEQSKSAKLQVEGGDELPPKDASVLITASCVAADCASAARGILQSLFEPADHILQFGGDACDFLGHFAHIPNARFVLFGYGGDFFEIVGHLFRRGRLFFGA